MALRGEEGWHAAHAQHFGAERWEELHQALHKEVEHVCFLNPFLPPEAATTVSHEYSLLQTGIPGAFAFQVPEDPEVNYQIEEDNEENTIFVKTERDPWAVGKLQGLSPFFLVDGASLIVAMALRPEQEDCVLDACAAPGGKALALASTMFAKRLQGDWTREDLYGRLVCNDFCKQSAARMQRNMRRFLPEVLFEEDGYQGPHIVFTSADFGATSSSAERHGPYDKILLDAPCTQDRSILREGGARLDKWSAATPKVSSERQLKWLQKALWLLKEGGVILYTTQSLAHEECEGVVERLLWKIRGSFEVEVLPLEEDILRMVPSLAAESTDWGTRILPDKATFGPRFFARLRLVRMTHGALAGVAGN